MNRVFYIFRHGETDWNKEGRLQGHTDTPLNLNGLMQAQILAEQLMSIDLDIVVSSDLKRALVTGRTVAEKKSIPLIIDSGLREMSFGEAEGMLYSEAFKLFGEEFFRNGEAKKEAHGRFVASLKNIIETTDHQFIGISTHGGALRSVIHGFLPADHPTIAIPNCVVYKLFYNFQTKSFMADSNPLFPLFACKGPDKF